MKIIIHRVNDLKQLRQIKNYDYGCEIDVRYHNEDLVLWHDPFHHPKHQPQLFDDWLSEYQLKGSMILNVKTEGIELECIELMRRYEIPNYFFLDLSMPYFVKYALLAEKGGREGFSRQNLAVRFSEFEPIEYALAFEGKASWVWVDCFTGLPLDEQVVDAFRSAGLSTCIVSPELQGHSTDRIPEFREKMASMRYSPDAVCTKHPQLWEN